MGERYSSRISSRSEETNACRIQWEAKLRDTGQVFHFLLVRRQGWSDVSSKKTWRRILYGENSLKSG